ncbi:MAG: tRNA pseudouridine(55) synthase TruB [Chlorobiaceae bacterium]|nr:tRNA pseudouridine(55) synthase TruB [Chlorobiales bacterium]NTU91660.1 tRNA pseudouridine(55) synthase TruB [Chlorobiaceae bacterium]NTV26366.1 tRNA pseudouridine(55) synthase TruB [Chlorobiaceae bacterium]
MVTAERMPVLSEEGDFILVDKPLDWTSFDVVARVRGAFKRNGMPRKVGHCGTLDPKATGLLILATGRKTKSISSLEALDKEYDGVIRLGARTVSHDTESPEYDLCDTGHLTAEEIRAAAASFVGTRMQQPPMHSAVWHNGQRLYELARQGHEVKERKSRQIEITRFEITEISLPEVRFVVRVSKGAYIRVIAHEFGELLGVGGYLGALRRTAIGDYRLDAAMSVEGIVEEIARVAATIEG